MILRQIERALRAFMDEERGVSALEYAVLAVAIVLVVIAAASLLGQSVSGLFVRIASSL